VNAVIEEIERSEKNVLGFRAVGDITKEDYSTLGTAVEEAVDEYGDIDLVLDLTDFKWEKVEAWGADLHFGHEYHDKIEKMALVGDHSWVKFLAKIADPFYAKEAEWFAETADAWKWVED
jgi:hypothetical protein